MTNLVPVRRMNKNGVWSVRYMRPDSAHSQTGKGLPQPSVTGNSLKKSVSLSAPYPRQKRRRTFSQYDFRFKPDPVLQQYLERDGRTGKISGDYYWNGTALEAYDVISTVSPDNAVILLAHGVRSSAEVRKVLSAAAASHLVEDNAAVAQDALSQGVDVDLFLNSYCNHRHTFGEDSQKSMMVPSSTDNSFLKSRVSGSKDASTLEEMVGADEISLEHLKFIGMPRFIDALDTDGLLISELKRMQSGTSLYTPEDLDVWIDKFQLNGKKSQVHMKRVIYTLGKRHGREYVNALDNEMISLFGTYEYSRLATQWGYTPERERDFISFGHDIKQGIYKVARESANLSDDEYKLLFEAGVTPDVVAEGYGSGLNAPQIIAVRMHGIQPSISDGWI